MNIDRNIPFLLLFKTDPAPKSLSQIKEEAYHTKTWAIRSEECRLFLFPGYCFIPVRQIRITKMLTLLNSAVDILRSKHKHGDG